MNFLKEQFYIVTGGSSGLGRATAKLLNEQGASVVAIARREDKLKELKSECKYPENLYIEVKDLTADIEGLPKYVKELKEKYGKFSGMAYCAGVANIQPLQLLDIQEMRNTFDINYFAPIQMIKGMADKRNNVGEGTSIVTIASISALTRDKGHIGYAGSKAALCASLKCISKEVVSKGVRVNWVSPSNIKTPINDVAEYEESQKDLYPFGFGEPTDVANMIVYLLSNKSKFISGQNYVIDSGGVL